MRYAEFLGCHTYVVVRTTGFGEQGGEPIQEHEIVYSSEDYDRAMDYGKRLFPQDSSGWTYNSFVIHVNTLTDQGKIRLLEFEGEMARIERDIQEHPERYKTYHLPWGKVVLEYNPIFDGPLPPAGTS